MNGTKKHSFYLLVICTVVMFGIAAYLLVSGGSSHGTIWGGRYGDKLEGTINGYGVLMIAVGMLFYTLLWRWQNRQKGFSISMGEVENIIIGHADAKQVKELLSSEYWNVKILLFVKNNANGHILQMSRIDTEKIRICLSIKNSTYQLADFSHKEALFSSRQTNEVVDDYFRSSNLFNRKEVCVEETTIIEDMEHRITSLLLPAPETELETSSKELDNKVTWLLHNNRKMDNYLKLETFSKDERLCGYVCDTLRSLPETPTLAAYKDYKAIIVLLGISTTHYAILDELAEQHRKRNDIPELTAYCDALHWMRPGRQYLCNIYNTVCHAFHLLRRNPVRDNRLLITEQELRHAERMLPELGKQTFIEMVRMKGYKIYNAEELAEKCGMEYGSFRRKMKKVTGYTAKQWVIKERAKDVEHYLMNTSFTLTEVAFTTGFASTSNLNDFCRAYLLDTPGEIRRKAQETRKCTDIRM